jgi:hypothetical protein
LQGLLKRRKHFRLREWILLAGYTITTHNKLSVVSSHFFTDNRYSQFGGALVSTGIEETGVAGRGAAGLVKSGTKVIANDYEYVMAA